MANEGGRGGQNPQGDGRDDTGGDRPGRGHTPLAEWIVAGISTVLVLAMLGFTLYEALLRPSSPPALTVRADSAVAVPGGHLVLLTVRNEGGETAANVLVRGELRSGGSRIEEGEVTVDYVPVAGERRASLHFRNDPAAHELRVRVVGYLPP